MNVSVFDLFQIGIGPSSSHTVGPMRAATAFARLLALEGGLCRVERVDVELFGSLGATGQGHGSDKAILLGLEGVNPARASAEQANATLERVHKTKTLTLLGSQEVEFDPSRHLILHRKKRHPGHTNAMCFTAFNKAGEKLVSTVYYSLGGGAIALEGDQNPLCSDTDSGQHSPFSFASAAELLAHCEQQGVGISQIMLCNERVHRSESEITNRLEEIWQTMEACVTRGCHAEGILPGGLSLVRRAPELFHKLNAPQPDCPVPLGTMDWVNLFALAVSEENAAGAQVVTAPTNGAAGIIPAVMLYYKRFCHDSSDAGIINFLLTAGAIGSLYKLNASISGAEVGCQGEVGAACSMAAGALTEVLGGTPRQVENAAEIAMEHNLGLTCDPVSGLVQVPCIERNAMAAIKAINASRLAMRGDGQHYVSLDDVIRTMRDTGRDMKSKYKETARGGLAVNVAEC
ncbi:MAG: L-serine ammonia-lyase [Gammaproteobacteria bacterium]|nr:L-serine ammonia-lyase [Gammaproteobacteria bacterium]